jgi:hypothetical protein
VVGGNIGLLLLPPYAFRSSIHLCFLHHSDFKMEIVWRSIQDEDGKQKSDGFISICYGKSTIWAMSF